jgi:hypothetical protein
MADSTRAAVAGLRHALDGMADALEGVRFEAFLDSTAAFTAALATCRSGLRIDDSDQAALSLELVGARAQLRRCLRFGSSLDDLIQMTVTPQGLSGGYGRDGQRSAPECTAMVDERV